MILQVICLKEVEVEVEENMRWMRLISLIKYEKEKSRFNLPHSRQVINCGHHAAQNEMLLIGLQQLTMVSGPLKSPPQETTKMIAEDSLYPEMKKDTNIKILLLNVTSLGSFFFSLGCEWLIICLDKVLYTERLFFGLNNCLNLSRCV